MIPVLPGFPKPRLYILAHDGWTSHVAEYVLWYLYTGVPQEALERIFEILGAKDALRNLKEHFDGKDIG